MNDIIEKEKKLATYDGSDRVVHFSEYLKIKEDNKTEHSIHLSGFKSFDEKLDGLMDGEVTVISGRTGEGKTLFAESWIREMMMNDQDLKSCVFSFEVTTESFLQKHKESLSMPLYVPLELKAMDPAWLSERIEEARLKYDCRIFMIDHLHYLVDMATQQNMSLNIGAFMRHLKITALKLNVAILLIAHQKASEKGQEQGSIDGLRDSSFIGQEADNVIIISRRADLSVSELNDLQDRNPVAYEGISRRIKMDRSRVGKDYLDQLAYVQIAKGRRNGAYRWTKLFQKVGNYLEEI